MKEMIYQDCRMREVLDRGTIDGYEYVILSLGIHPTAYVKVPENHPACGKYYGDLDISVHGGLTYGEDYLDTSYDDEEKGWWIGWDYAHLGDCSCYFGMEDGKKYTTEEIHEAVESVIAQLKEMEANNA